MQTENSRSMLGKSLFNAYERKWGLLMMGIIFQLVVIFTFITNIKRFKVDQGVHTRHESTSCSIDRILRREERRLLSSHVGRHVNGVRERRTWRKHVSALQDHSTRLK